MNGAILLILVLVIIGLTSWLSKIKPESIKTPKAIADLNSATSWNIKFFDNNEWVKETLINFLKTIFFFICFFFRTIVWSFKGVLSLVKKIKV
jgi:hypothetical protein